ncbi:lysozyme family protein [Ectobacillus funiculus]|uniref:Lysozyme family protein n=1 Tax=Ectobacillus funiculus TaxID=137993 RepID=A0ABV5WEH4_9BACI
MISLGIRYYKEILIGLCLLFAIIFVLFLGVDMPKDNTVPLTDGGVAVVSPLVQQYEPLLRKYAREHGIESYVPLMMALMQQESGDPMQSSESQGHPPGYFQNPEESIKYGVLHFKNVITNAKGDIKLALQSYNFGPGFIDYVLARGGKYTAELTKEFSAYMSGKLGWTCSYWQTSPFCYGDIKYVEHVLRYYQEDATPVSIVSTTANAYGFIQPIGNPKVMGTGETHSTH